MEDQKPDIQIPDDPDLRRESTKDKYILERGFHANTRQNLQFYLWKDGGYTLHPSIPVNLGGLHVAEIGLATGIWLVDLAGYLPPSAHIDGFDIDISQCAPIDWLPSNVSLYTVNCVEPFPEQFVGKYDIVHIQLFHLAVQNNDPEPIVKNLLTLLKPGGYISWGEYDYSKWEIVRSKQATGGSIDHLTSLLDDIGTIGGTKPDWARNFWPARLPEIYKENGLVEIAVDERPFRKEVLQFQLDTALMASDEIARTAIDPLGNGKGDRTRELIQKAFADRGNKAFNVSRLTVVGRRPV
ncbi:hypothetical protein G7Y89_g8850 [Cudoniella acicularis]|uniref:Methyltransferase domain-containing protein n=1 Tax=Cudoniella acicularis TaxID=354080 RepID=A0A8H4RFU2_9HELO|nr:hypothetical protein G7Y89_g8850 [Cudoniella acicularis]